MKCFLFTYETPETDRWYFRHSWSSLCAPHCPHSPAWSEVFGLRSTVRLSGTISRSSNTFTALRLFLTVISPLEVVILTACSRDWFYYFKLCFCVAVFFCFIRLYGYAPVWTNSINEYSIITIIIRRRWCGPLSLQKMQDDTLFCLHSKQTERVRSSVCTVDRQRVRCSICTVDRQRVRCSICTVDRQRVHCSICTVDRVYGPVSVQ